MNQSEYGELDITINLSKPEKDPKAIAAAKNAPQTAYPKCQLCKENEGYAGRMNHPARANHRIILIEVMGLAVRPSRLKQELTDLAAAVVKGEDVASDPVLEKHTSWIEELKKTYTFTEENAMDIILQETGKVFSAVLEDAGVYKNTEEGKNAFIRFVDTVNHEA